MGYDGTLKFDTSIDSSGFQSGLSKLSGMASGAIKATTTILAGAATAVAGIGTAAIKVGSDFEAGMSKVQSISGASATEIQQLADKAKEMGAKTKFSATESAEAFQYMAMAGWKTGDMLNSIEGIMNLAAASGEDLASTSDIVTDAMTAFGLAADGTTTIIKNGYSKEVSNATHFADVLAKAALGIHSPSKVFADEIGKWIPPGIGVGIEAEMPDLYKQMDDEMASLGKRMQTAVNVETGKIAVDKKVSTTYKVEKEKQGVFESGDTTVEITGETHVHVDLDGREVGDATTPIVDENMARIDTHKKRGG